MPARIDETGQRYGSWVILKYIPPSERTTADKDLSYLAQCDCGTIRPIRINDLRRGKSTNCGCKKKKDWNIEIGKTYGEITVLEQLCNRHGNPLQKYRCRCSCGQEVEWPADYINKKKNCGCQFQKGFDTIQDMIGEQYGKLKVLAVSDKRDNYGKRSYRICQCECGNIIEIYRGHLKNGHTKSCGCVESFGEEWVAQFLNCKKIPYIRQYKFNNLNDKAPLRFDFCLLLDDLPVGLIEIQGIQHYDSKSFYYSDALIQHDVMKRQYAQERKIPLLLLDYSKGKEKTNYKKWQMQIEELLEGIYGRVYRE